MRGSTIHCAQARLDIKITLTDNVVVNKCSLLFYMGSLTLHTDVKAQRKVGAHSARHPRSV